MIDRAEQAAKKAKTLGDHEAYSAAMRELHKGLKIGFEEMAALRHATAVAKIPHVIEHVRGCLENVDKLVVFVHHHDVANALLEAFPNAALVTGEIKPGSRTAQVDQFQHDPNCRVFIGSIQAAGVGLTLTAAQLAIFAELDWVPGNINQAEDRLHRIGQLGSVLIQHLVFVDSVDSYMANMIIDKLETIEAALDTRTKPIEGPTEEQILEASARLREIEAQKTSPYLDASLTQRGRGQVLDEVETEVPF
jgi:SWI/SNF-related matrix-associated actin-dependent regulator 1 of chromatin subfamily A